MAGPAFVVVGRITAPHGVRGEVRLWPETDFPERFRPGRRVQLWPPGSGEGSGPPARWSTVLAVRPHPKGLLVLRLEGVGTRDEAEALRGYWLRVPADQLDPLPEGHFYHHQVLGVECRTEEGASLGRVAEIRRTGANDVYVVRDDRGREALIPATRQVVVSLDPASGIMVIRPLPGLLEEGAGGE